MRIVTRIPAIALQSVAHRYRRRAHALPEGSHGIVRYGTPGRQTRKADPEDPIARRQRVEAVLLLSREPMNSRKLAQLARLTDGTEARTIVRQLNELYDDVGRAFRIEEVAGGFQLLTRRHFATWLQRLEHVPPQVRLSAPAMETLAVVAYRQPVVRAEVEAVRGVNCGEILRQLMERELVRIGGRSDELGRPYLYTTTKRFLQLFGLQNVEDLPRACAFRDDEGSADSLNPESLSASTSNGEATKEQEKSEVSVTSATQMPVDELSVDPTAVVSSVAAVVVPEGNYDNDDFEEDEEYEFEDDEFEDDEEWDDDDDDDDDVDEDFDDEDDDDDFEEDEWEEVEDDDDDDDDVDDDDDDDDDEVGDEGDDDEWDEDEEEWEDDDDEEEWVEEDDEDDD